jgi:glutathione S-transferase
MTKLFYSSSSCGAASFIAAYATGLNITCEKVDLGTHKTSSGDDFYLINAKGNLPCLLFDDGSVLNENFSVLSWIADQVALVNPKKIAPLNGTQDRYVLQCVFSFISTELHSAIGGLFAEHSAEITTYIRNKVNGKLRYLNDYLLPSPTSGKDFLVWADTPSIADFYLYVILSWCSSLSVDLAPFPRAQAFYSRMFNLQVIREAHSRMNSDPSCVMGTIHEKIQPTLDKITSSLSSVHHETVPPAVEKLSEKLQTTVNSTSSSSSSSSSAYSGMMGAPSTTMKDSSTTAGPSTGEKIESKLSQFHHETFDPAVEKLSEKLQPTVDKMESGALNIRVYGNQKISEMQTKMNGPSSSTSTGIMSGPTTGEKIESELSHLHHDKFEPAVEKLGEKLQPTVDKMESGAEKTRDYGNEKLTEMGYKSKPFVEDAENKKPINQI